MQHIGITEKDRILIIAPHPDDECIGPGGILLLYAKQCDVVLLTDGRQGQGDLDQKECRKIRRTEFISEMERLGVRSYRMLDIEDGTLLSHTDCLVGDKISEYSMIFVTGPDDDHPDHKAAYLCLKKAAADIQEEKMPRCFMYEVHTPLQHPTCFLDITAILDEKCSLIRMHASQIGELPYDQLAGQCAAYRGTLYRMPKKKIEVYEEVYLRNNSETNITETDVLLQKERLKGWILKRWVRNLMEGKTLNSWYKEEGADEVYVYGYGELGKLLLRGLGRDRIRIRAVIDTRAEQFRNGGFIMIRPEEIADVHTGNKDNDLPVIVTAIYEYDSIKESLSAKGFSRVFSINDLVESMQA